MHHLLSRVGDEGLSRIFLVFFSSFLTSQVIFLSHKKSTPQTFQTSNIQFLNVKFSCFHQRKWNSNFKVMIKNIFYGSSSSFYLHQKRIVPSLESSLTNYTNLCTLQKFFANSKNPIELFSSFYTVF